MAKIDCHYGDASVGAVAPTEGCHYRWQRRKSYSKTFLTEILNQEGRVPPELEDFPSRWGDIMAHRAPSKSNLDGIAERKFRGSPSRPPTPIPNRNQPRRGENESTMVLRSSLLSWILLRTSPRCESPSKTNVLKTNLLTAP